jgi:hypothetical protein
MQYEFHLDIANIVRASIKNNHGQQIVTATYPNTPSSLHREIETNGEGGGGDL